MHNDSLPNFVRFQYLQTSLTGEAGSLIKHFKSTEANFGTAWEILKDFMIITGL